MSSVNQFYTVRGYQLQDKGRQVTEAMEDYMEMIVRLCKKQPSVHVGEIAKQLHIAGSSVTKMARKMSSLGLVNYQKHGAVSPTDQGRALGQYFLVRHQQIETFLQNIGVTEDLLRQTELIEHQITPHTLEVISDFNRLIVQHPDWRDILQNKETE
ncbi:metal-dependent transcriptional regulator [[Clostridium] leptum]|nr:metal-dependent transcriptional regulator [[Clostridium] leptum]